MKDIWWAVQSEIFIGKSTVDRDIAIVGAEEFAHKIDGTFYSFRRSK